MDPVVNFSIEVVEMIFDFLTPAEILNCTLVSHGWNDTIRSSTKCMGNFVLGLRGDWIDFEQDNKFVTSGGKYSNIIISEGTEIFDLIYEVMCANHNWKSVKIIGMKFKTLYDCLKLLKTCESSVETLTLCSLTIQTFDECSEDICIKNLKNLRISYCSTEISLSVLKNCQQLSSLALGNTDEGRLIEIAPYLRNFKKLKVFNISSEWFDFIFDCDSNYYNFELEVLSVINSSEVKNSQSIRKIEQNFVKFLGNQAKTLKNISLIGMFSFEVLAEIFQMKNLQRLSASSLGVHNWSTVEYPKSLSIQKLDIATDHLASRVVFLSIIKSVPNLKILRMRSIDLGIAKLISENLRHLEKVILVHRQPMSVTKILQKVVWE